MKKLFTFLMAMVITTMVFGQFTKTYYPLDQPILATQDDRTGWIGGTEDYQYYFELVEGEKIAMRLPAAGELPTGNLTVTKVGFGWQSGVTGTSTVFDPNFRILIYAGGNGDWINLEECTTTIIYTTDTNVQGNLLYSQDYMCENNGWQIVELNEPVALPANQEIWIAIQALGASCTWVCPDDNGEHQDWWGQYLDFFNTTNMGHIWFVPAFGDNPPYVTAKYALKVLIDNGEAYQNTTDWWAQMYSVQSAEDQESITYLYVDDFMMEDSLYLAFGIWNMGPDANTADGRVHMYIENTEYDIIDTNLGVMLEDLTIESGRGLLYRNTGGILAFSDMDEMGLTFPFNVCISYESFGYDPVASNNTACAEITDIDLGVSETANTLTISPNPASTYIKVENAAGSQITVYNLAGQEVLSVASAEANETLNVSNLNAGLYIVRVVNGNEVSTAKVSIVR